jgi:signal transduction histidine kinase
MGEEVISLMQQVAGSKGIQIRLDIDDGAGVYCDCNQISSVLRNLVSNSIKFTASGGSVVISSRAIKDGYVITVSDNGVGIEQNKLDLMLRQRISYTTKGTDNEPGTGLGISLIAEFVEKNGGKLIGSSRPGHGTSFSFSLLVATKESNEANSRSEV